MTLTLDELLVQISEQKDVLDILEICDITAEELVRMIMDTSPNKILDKVEEYELKGYDDEPREEKET